MDKQLEDLKNSIEQLQKQISKQVIDANVKKAVKLTAEIERIASKKLNNSYEPFMKGVTVETDTVKQTITVVLSNFSNSVEQGSSSYDLKPILLNSAKAKTSKKGDRYLNVPIKQFIIQNTIKNKLKKFFNKFGFKNKLAKKQNGINFVTVSDKSEPDSWIHPGFKAHNIVKQAIKNIF